MSRADGVDRRLGRRPVGLIWGFLFLIELAGCRSPRTVELEKVSADSVLSLRRSHEVQRNDVRVAVCDSVRELIIITLNERNDTLRTDREVIRTREKQIEHASKNERFEIDSVSNISLKQEEKQIYVTGRRGLLSGLKRWMAWGLVTAIVLTLAFKRFGRMITK